MSFNNDFETLAGMARERQAEMLRLSGQGESRPSRLPMLVGALVAVCAPLAALFFLRVW